MTTYYTVEECLQLLVSLSDNMPIYRPATQPPQAANALVDFRYPLYGTYMEAAAYLLAQQIERDHRACRRHDLRRMKLFICSMGVRGAGALAHAVARRLDAPYSLSDWYPPGSVGEFDLGACTGVGGEGTLYLNGLREDHCVVLIADRVLKGESLLHLVEAVNKKKGCQLLATYTVYEAVLGTPGKGREGLAALGVHLTPLVLVEYTGDRSRAYLPPSSEWTTVGTGSIGVVDGAAESDVEVDEMVVVGAAPPTTALVGRPSMTPWARRLRQMEPEVLADKMQRISDMFLHIPIHYNDHIDYPYCFFSLTDFIPALEPSLVEDMADVCVHLCDFNARCDVLVSEGDRGGGPLLQAVSVRTGLPYVIAHWIGQDSELEEAAAEAAAAAGAGGGRNATTGGEVRSTVTNIGFSGAASQIGLRGVRAGQRCAFVDDMLSSGGTAEAIFDCITRMGAQVLEAVFASEKLYPQAATKDKQGRDAAATEKNGDAPLPLRKGYNRLRSKYPQCRLTTLVQFVVEEKETQAPRCRVGE